jgi:hypothetical protein
MLGTGAALMSGVTLAFIINPAELTDEEAASDAVGAAALVNAGPVPKTPAYEGPLLIAGG